MELSGSEAAPRMDTTQTEARLCGLDADLIMLGLVCPLGL